MISSTKKSWNFTTHRCLQHFMSPRWRSSSIMTLNVDIPTTKHYFRSHIKTSTKQLILYSSNSSRINCDSEISDEKFMFVNGSSVLNLNGDREYAWWTGKHPVDCPGFNSQTRVLQSIPQISFAQGVTKHGLRSYFDNSWTLTEVLFSSLQGQDSFYRRPYHKLRHPMIFYYGHPAVLYVNKLRVAGLLKMPIDSYFENIFQTGVDEMSWDDLSMKSTQWPSVEAVCDYRRSVYKTLTNLIDNIADDCFPIGKDNPLWALLLAMEHERIHFDTSSVLIAELPVNLVAFPKFTPHYHPAVKEANTSLSSVKLYAPTKGVDYPINTMIPVCRQTVHIGKPQHFPSFGWFVDFEFKFTSLERCRVTFLLLI